MITTARRALPSKRTGWPHWWAGYTSMLRWEFTNMRLLLPITVLVQIASGAGLVIGFGLLLPEIPERVALYLSTGAVVVTLVTVGLVLGPQLVAQQKLSGSYDFMWSLPVPRTSATAAWLTLNVAIAVPGMLAALLMARLRYGVDFVVSPWVPAAVLLTLATATLLGYALAHAIPKPEVTQLITQLLIFAVFGFSPISFPAENLPGWLASLHDYLPFEHMANVVRSGLTQGLAGDVGRSYVTLAIWAGGAAAISAWVLGRRK